MKKNNFLTTPLLLAVLIFGFTSLASAEDFPETTMELRNAAAKTKLEETPDSVLVYVKGLCCPSCAIGIRKHVSKLDFVDRKRLSKGVDLDAKVQLAVVALKDGHTPDLAALAKAIDDAGYDPVQLYRLDGGSLKTTPLVVPES